MCIVDLGNRRLDQATFQALQALIARGHLRVSEQLARAIRKRREALDLPVNTLAERCGAEVMEIRDIENGACSITAPMLVQLSKALEVDLVWFIQQEPSFFSHADAGPPLDLQDTLLGAKEGLELIRAFNAIKDPTARKAVVDLAQQFAASEKTGGEPPDKKE